MRTIVKLRELLSSHQGTARKIEAMESKYDQRFQVVFDAIRKLIEPPPVPTTRRIGFNIHDDDHD